MRKLGKIIVRIVVLLCICSFILSLRKEYATEENGWNLILVNRDYYIPQEYTVELVQLDNGEKVDERIYPYLQKMFDVAEKEGVYMVVADGYRTAEEQEELMYAKVAEYQKQVSVKFLAKRMAEKWVAIPGTSEHQLGMAVDINADITNSSSSEVYGWLEKHAYEFGFIRRYPPNKTEITGISYEPWHYRYVGEEAAKKIYEKDMCLEEYVESLQKNHPLL